MHIEATDVTKTYGDVTALDGLSLSIPTGSTAGLLGTNGAGKTTLFRLLIGHETPDAGTVRIGGESVADAGPRIRERVAYLPERVGFPPELTAREVVATTARVRDRDDAEERVASALEAVGLADDADRRVDGFSNGMRRRLGLATALVPDPDVLLLDEPTAGLDPLGVVAFHRVVEAVRDRTDATVLVCSHALAEVERLCDRAAILDDGELVATGDLGDLAAGEERTVRVRRADPELRRAAAEACQSVTDACDAVAESRVTEREVVVDVPPDELLTVLTALDDAVGLDGVEVDGSDLESAFAELVGDDSGSATPSDRTAPGAPTDGGDAATEEGSP